MRRVIVFIGTGILILLMAVGSLMARGGRTAHGGAEAAPGQAGPVAHPTHT